MKSSAPVFHTRWLAAAFLITSTALGGLVSGGGLERKAVLTIFLLALPLFLPLRVTVRIVVLASFFSRFEVSVLGRHLRAEQLAVLMLAVALLRYKSQRARAQFVLPLVAFAVFTAWDFVTSVLLAPDVSRSTDIVLWLALDGVLLLCLARLPREVPNIIRTGTRAAALFSVVAVVVWLSASIGGPQVGVQRDTGYGGFAAYVTSYEANVAASLILLWSLTALASPYAGTWSRRILLFVAPLSLLATQTRAALAAYGACLVVYAFFRRGEGRLRRIVSVLVAVGAAAGAIVLFVSPDMPGLARKLIDITNPNGQDAVVRFITWRLALADLRGNRWLFGLGANSYGQRHLDFTRPTLNAPGYLGNLPLQLLYDAGVVGVATLLIILGVVAFRRGLHDWAVRLGTLAYLAVSISTSFYWLASTYIFLALALHDKAPKPQRLVPADPWTRQNGFIRRSSGKGPSPHVLQRKRAPI